MNREELLRALIAETDAPLAQAEAAVREAQRQLDQVKSERYGLELALARHIREPAPLPELAPPVARDTQPREGDGGWLGLGRTDAAERVLRETGTPMHRKDILAMLHARGRDDSIEALSAALAYLKRKGRAVGMARGFWVHPDYADASVSGSESTDSTEAPAVVPEQGDGPAPTGPSTDYQEGGDDGLRHSPHRHQPPVAS